MKKHLGGCHCGKVRFEAVMELKNAMECNCSICIKRGSLLDFVPMTNFKITQGENELTEYLWNKMHIHHKFCKTCGILPFANALAPDGTDMAAINVRCLDGFSLDQVKITQYDGKSR